MKFRFRYKNMMQNMMQNMMHKEKAQASVEFFLVISIAFLVFSSVLYAINVSMINSDQAIMIASAQRAVQQLKLDSDMAFYHRSPSELTAYIYLPKGVSTFIASNKTITIRVETNPYTDIYAITKGNLNPVNFSVKEGYYTFKINATENNSISIYLR